jgi:hypothetical protein
MPDESILIPLPRGLFAIIDASDTERVLPYRWFLSGGYVRRTEVRTGPGPRATILLARVILDAPSGTEVDHINQNKLDNRRANLRFATRRQNSRNRGPNANNTSGFKGVTWHKRTRRWHAQIGIGGRPYYVGSFDTAEDAAHAYNEAALETFGEFAWLNEV